MRAAATLVALILIVFPARGLSAQVVDRSKLPELPPPPALKLPAVQTTVLPNGLTLAIVEVHKVPVVDVQLLIDAGAARDASGAPGLATFTATVQQRDEPVSVANIAFPAIVYGREHPYGHPLNGTDSATARLARASVAEFYRTNYRPNGARILIVGDVTLAQARRLIAARFGGWERGDVPAFPSPAAAPPTAARTVHLIDKPGAAQPVARIAHPGP